MHKDPTEISPAWNTSAEEDIPSDLTSSLQRPKPGKEYYPLSDTLRLYAGWLLAWYLAIYAIGWYQQTRSLPLHLPIIDELFRSSLIFGFTLATFLLLLLSSVHRAIGRGLVAGALLTVLGIVLWTVLSGNV